MMGYPKSTRHTRSNSTLSDYGRKMFIKKTALKSSQHANKKCVARCGRSRRCPPGVCPFVKGNPPPSHTIAGRQDSNQHTHTHTHTHTLSILYLNIGFRTHLQTNIHCEMHIQIWANTQTQLTSNKLNKKSTELLLPGLPPPTVCFVEMRVVGCANYNGDYAPKLTSRESLEVVLLEWYLRNVWVKIVI